MKFNDDDHINYLAERDKFNKEFMENDDVKTETRIGVSSRTNVVTGDTLRNIQNETLKMLKDYISMTFGPMGSNTQIITGHDRAAIKSAYSKDGLKVLKSILFDNPIEMSIAAEILETVRHVETQVGDGTTSSTILASLIFERLLKIQEKHKVPPFQLIRIFKEVVESIKERILASGRECTIDDIYNISMISTNGNAEVSENIMNIYKQYGMDVDITLGIATGFESVLKSYDGLTITEGMSDPVYINNKEKGSCEIYNAHVYHFADPIDTFDMIALFEAIIDHNVYEAIDNDEDIIPTVITCPRLSADMSRTLKDLAEKIYQFGSGSIPVLVITNVVASDELIMDDIANLCGCKSIKKYIDPRLLAKDQEAGKAPTIDNVWEFYGEAELVVSDTKKTKFINPKHMHVYKEDGTIEEDPMYTAMVNFLETEIKNAKDTGNANEIGLLKKRLAALKANSVDYLIGGVTVSERDAIKDLVEDAIKNCKSASLYGVGRAANFEGLYHSFAELNQRKQNVEEGDIYTDIARCIFSAYCDITKILYNTVCTDDELVDCYIMQSLENGAPYDISLGELPALQCKDNTVLCSIKLDVNILDTLSKIITMMVTCNQCLVQSVAANIY